MIAVLVFLALVVFVFLIQSRISQPSYELRGVFTSSAGLQPGDPVRVAGIDVGEVNGIAAGPHNTTVVSMLVSSSGQPIFANATLSIIPRLVLEGAYYVSLDPGSPGAGRLKSGTTIPESRTSIPVQLDQFLDTFTLPVRNSMSQLVKGLSTGFGGPGTAGFRDDIADLDHWLPSMSASAAATEGTGVGDLHRAIISLRNLTTGLAAHPVALGALVGHFDRLMGDLADEQQPLSQAISSLDAVERTSRPTLTALNHALPEVGSFSRTLDPALRDSPKPLAATSRLLDAVDATAKPSEALLAKTKPISATLPQLEGRLEPIVKLVTPAAECLGDNVVPTLDTEVPDGSLSTGDPAWLDMLHGFTAITSVTGGFDGNGAAVRTGIVGSVSEFAGILPGLGKVEGIGPTINGLDPTWLGYGVDPPYRPDEWCDKQPLPDLGARRSAEEPQWEKNALQLQLTGPADALVGQR